MLIKHFISSSSHLHLYKAFRFVNYNYATEKCNVASIGHFIPDHIMLFE